MPTGKPSWRVAGASGALIVVTLAALFFYGRGAQDEATQEEKRADYAEASLTDLCDTGSRAACRALADLADLSKSTSDDVDDPDPIDDPDPDDPEIQDPEIDDPDPDDPEVQQSERDDPEPDDPPAQDGAPGATGPQGPAGPPGPAGADATCAGEFVCEAELEAILADYAPRSWVIDLLQALGCELTGLGSEVLTCTITGKP